MSVILRNNDIIVLRDHASLNYLQGEDEKNENRLALVPSSISQLQASIHFHLISTTLNDYWFIKTSTGKFLKVNEEEGPYQDSVIWSNNDPTSDEVVDKSSYYFRFIPLLIQNETFYVIATYYNDGMTLQQPGGPNTQIYMNTREEEVGHSPELLFNISVVYSQEMKNNETKVASDIKESELKTTTSASTTTSLSTGAIIAIIIFSLAVLVTLCFLAYRLWMNYHPQMTTVKEELEPTEIPSETEAPTTTETEVAMAEPLPTESTATVETETQPIPEPSASVETEPSEIPESQVPQGSEVSEAKEATSNTEETVVVNPSGAEEPVITTEEPVPTPEAATADVKVNGGYNLNNNSRRVENPYFRAGYFGPPLSNNMIMNNDMNTRFGGFAHRTYGNNNRWNRKNIKMDSGHGSY